VTGAAAIQSPQLEREKVNILVVDDLPEKHVVFRSILEELGQNIVSARSGQEALRFILEQEFAVILLDVNMPDIDGLETAGLIRQYKKSAQTPIVFITAYVDEVQAKRGYALGAVDYIPSPVVPEVLRSKVRVFVELFRMNRQLQVQAAAREALARSEAARAAAEEAIHRADYLAEASRVLSRSLNLDATAAAVLDLCVPLLGERAILGLATANAGVRRLQMHPPAEAGDAEAFSPQLRAAADEAVREKQFKLWSNGNRAAAICPLMAGDEVRGTLVLLGEAESFDSNRVSLIREMVSRAAIAMENARLYTAVQDADRRKNEFLAMLAHELRNPLAPIRNAVHIMQGDGVTAATMNWARDVIGRQTDHMARLVDDLLDVSRIVQGKVVVKPEKLNLALLVERSVEASSPRTAGREQLLEVELPKEPIELNGDPVRLAQVLSNLINNASKFSGPHSHIKLSAAFEQGEVRISVKDNGPGIDPAFLPHIFDLFAQADQSLDRSQGGLGIGLTLVRRLIEMHGGTVEAHSEGADRGCEFVVCLPLGPVQQTADSNGQRKVECKNDAPAPARRILVVDDNRDSAESLAILLRIVGNEVQIAHDGLSALEAGKTFRPAVVLLDIGLPGMDGYEVARKLRKTPEGKDALLIAQTGWGQEEDRLRSTEAGFDAHLTKPLDLAALQSVLANLDPAPAAAAMVE
jgi:signal transduction histidine kinase